MVTHVFALAAAARQPLSTSLHTIDTYEALAQRGLDLRVVVKFEDRDFVRLSADGTPGAIQAAASTRARINATFAAVGARSIRAIFGAAATKVEALAARAAQRSGRGQPDLLGLAELELRDATPAASLAAAHAFDALPSVEFVEIAIDGTPPPRHHHHNNHGLGIMMDCSAHAHRHERANKSATPLFVHRQTYRGPDPGFDADWAMSQGADGTGVRLSDCEYCWIFDHEDVRQGQPEPGWPCDPDFFPDHGTASLGVSTGIPNGIGITGVAPEAGGPYTYSEWTTNGGRRERAVGTAIADSAAGDVVLLEMQATCCGRRDYSPAETSAAVWMLVRAGSDAGVIVVAAAGNGNEDLDSAPYDEYMARGDSGSIMVGAGTASVEHRKASFSTYGSRVDVQAWEHIIA
jgi:hypothetical protein